MKFTVTWLPHASDRLAEIWLSSEDRVAITEAANRIEMDLRHDADQKGLDFFEERVLLHPPLAVTFHASLEDCLVTVIDIKTFEI